MNLSISDICSFTNTKPTSKNFIDGEQLFHKGHIITCAEEILECSNKGNNRYIHASCMRTLESDDAPHKIQVTVNNKGKIRNTECSCQTGDVETCKHIIGVLLYCNRHPLEELELLNPRPLLEHKCFEMKNSKIRRRTIDLVGNDKDEFASKIRKIIMQNLPDSALAKHMQV